MGKSIYKTVSHIKFNDPQTKKNKNLKTHQLKNSITQ